MFQTEVIDADLITVGEISVNDISAGDVNILVNQLPIPGTGSKYAVLFVPQELTKEQQIQAQKNVGLGDMKPSPVQIYKDAKNGII